jgi:AraC-like DNA-binding protein
MKTLSEMGARDYLNEVYAKEGGFTKMRERMKQIANKEITRKKVAIEFGISRPHLNTLIKMIEEMELKQ